MAEFRAALFDMDGVIIDSEPLHKRVVEAMAKELGCSITDEEYDAQVGRPPEEHMRVVKHKCGLDRSVDELTDERMDRYREFVKTHRVDPPPGMRKLLSELAGAGVALALCTSNREATAHVVMEKFGISGMFSAVVTSSGVSKGKPDPEIFLAGARSLGVAPADCLVVEDSENGVLAAHRAGMKCVGFANPNSGNMDLSRADLVAGGFREMDYPTLAGLFEEEA
jgi:HAD superfamily hydrolase (TIGR01509 family)